MRVLKQFLSPAERAGLSALEAAYMSAGEGMALRDVPPTSSAIAWVDGRPPLGSYLARYPVGTLRSPHVDPAAGPHLRLVALVRGALEGGELVVGGILVPLVAGDAVEFRADVEEHWVTEVRLGCRLALTVGAIDRREAALIGEPSLPR